MIRSSISCRLALMLFLALTVAPDLRSQAPPAKENRVSDLIRQAYFGVDLRAQEPAQKENQAAVVIRVHPDATLTVEGKPTKAKGERRRFNSPPLQPGKKYSYTFVAEWMPRNNYETYKVTRKVTVEAGKSVEVDMSKPDFEKGDTLLIIWVPTQPEVIDAMMKLAAVGKDDVVYDLGCGRGEIVIAAVKKYNAKHGVGIDIEAGQVQKAKANAKIAGVEDKVEFRQGDVLKDVNDLSKATVVTLYLSDELNQLLMPILQKQLKPGARIVSHRFTMGDWKPDKTVTVDLPREEIPEEKLIHLWTIEKK